MCIVSLGGRAYSPLLKQCYNTRDRVFNGEPSPVLQEGLRVCVCVQYSRSRPVRGQAKTRSTHSACRFFFHASKTKFLASYACPPPLMTTPMPQTSGSPKFEAKLNAATSTGRIASAPAKLDMPSTDSLKYYGGNNMAPRRRRSKPLTANELLRRQLNQDASAVQFAPSSARPHDAERHTESASTLSSADTERAVRCVRTA